MRSFYILIFSIIPFLMLGQINDCDNAMIVCNNGSITFNPQGPGQNDFANPNNNSGCLTANEHSSAWYYFEIEPGAPANQSLGFTIDPLGGAGQDYDFALFGPDVSCNGLGSPIRCSFAGPGCAFCPQTGLGMGTTDQTEGAGGDGFVSEITVQPGQGYFLLVDNFSSTGVGFNLSWTGSGANSLNCNAMPPCGLLANAGNPASACAGSNPITLNGSATGNAGTESYSWVGTNGSTAYLNNPNIANPTLTIPQGVSGSFDFTLTVDENGCTDNDIVTITISPAPNVFLTPPAPACSEAFPFAISANPLGGVWSPNAPNGVVDPSSLGVGVFPVTYTFTDNATGCSGTATTQVVITPSPTATIGFFNTQICENETPIFLTATPPGGTWSPNAPGGIIIPSNLGIGNWVVSYSYVDASGCSDVTDVQIVIFPEPTATIVNPGPLCETGSAVVLQANPPGGTWSPNAPGGAFIPSNFPPGTYPVTYTYTANYGCSTMVTENITVVSAPAIDILPPPPLCTSSSSYTLMATPAGGTWNSDFPNGVVNPASLGAGTFVATYTYQDPTGCLLVANENIVIGAPPTVSISPVSDLCVNGNPQNLIANPLGGTWSTNAFNGVFNPSAFTPGNYTVSYEYTDPNSGCSETATTNIQVVAQPTVGISGSSTFCAGTAAILTADAGFSSYIWSSNQTSNVISVNNTGTYTVTVTDASGCTATAQQSVSQSNNITPNISGITSICQGSPTTLTADAGYTSYAWSNNTNSNSITVSTGGTFTVTVTDASGCTGEASATVTTNTAPTPSILGTPSFCPGEMTTLSTQTFASYIWSDNSTSQTIPVSLPGTYTVTVTDGNGCTGTATTVVDINTVTTPTISGDLGFCIGNSTTLTASGGFTNYVWTTGSTTSTTTVSQNGMVGVTVTDGNGCTSETAVMVSENNNPSPSISGITSFCIGTSTTLDAGGGFSNYNWSNSGTGNSITVNQAGTFTVTVTDAFGCTGVDQVTVDITPELQPTISGNVSICDGASATLDAQTGYTSYIWSNNGTTSSITVSNSGTYTVTVTDAVGCTGSAETMVSTNIAPTPSILGTNSFCPGEMTTLSTQTFGSYIWSESSTSQTIPVSLPGTYTVTVTDVNGCTGTATTVVDINTVTTPTISGNLGFCIGNSTTLTADGGFTNYVWTTGSTTSTTTVSQNGMVGVTVTDGNGCTSETSVMVSENNNPAPSISGITSFCVGTSTTLDAGGGFTNYNWSNSGTGNSITVNQAGTFTVTVTDAFGCTGVDQVTVDITPELQPTISGNVSICDGASATLDAQTGYDSYIWSNNETTSSITVSNTGTYTVTVTDAVGCTGTAETMVSTNTAPTPSISGATSFCPGETTTINTQTFDSYIWSDNSTNQDLVVSATGTYTVTVTDGNGCTGTAEMMVNENIVNTPNISGDLDFCSGNSTTLTADGSFTDYVWTTGSTTSTTTISQNGMVGVTVTDANGCTSESSVMVSENNNPSPSISGITSFCIGTSTTLDAGGGFTNYSWSNSGTGNSITVNQAGTFTVTVTDAFGCTGVDQVTVDITPELQPSISGNVSICDGASATLDAQTGYTSYLWSNNGTTSSITVSNTGTYTVTVTDAVGCTGTAETMVSTNTAPTPSISGANSFCPGETTTISTETYASYIWSDNSTNQDLVVAATGTYTVTVTDGNGCTGTAEMMVNENMVNAPTISGDLDFCSGNSTTLTADGSFTDYVWTTGSTTSTTTISQNGMVGVTVTDANGCTSESSVMVSENNNPAPSISGITSFCVGTSTTLDAGGGFANYSWSNNETGNSITVNQAGTFTVTVTNASGCTGVDQVTVDITPELQPTISGNVSICDGASATLDAQTGYDSYIWSNNGTTSSITVSNTGTYTVTVTDATGCTGTAETIVNTNTAPTPSISGVNTFCPGETTTINTETFASYIWSDNSTNQDLVVAATGTYTVTVTDGNGCTGTAEMNVQENTTTIPNISGDLAFCVGNSTTLNVDGTFDNYVWSNNDNNPSTTISQGGAVGVTVTDANGCTTETSVIVVENQLPSPTISGATSICTGTSTTLDAGSNFTDYIWSDNSTGNSISVDQAGTFTVTVTDAQGCTGTEQVTVTVTPELEPTITGDANFCNGGSSVLDAGGGYTTYAWSDNTSNQTISPNVTGTFTVTVTDATGCTGTDEFFVTELPVPMPQISGSTSFCTGTSTTLDVGTTWASYIWSDNSTTNSISVSTAGTYEVTVTDNEGCTGITSVDIIESTSLNPAIVGDLGFCPNESTTLDAGLGFDTYAWSSGGTDQTLEVMQVGDYTVTVSDATGCTGTATVSVTENTPPSPTIVGQSSFCTGTSTTLDVGLGFASYSWTGGSTDPTLNVTQAGTYTVIVTDNNGCTGEASLMVQELASLDPAITGDQDFCEGNSSIISAVAGFDTYTWSDNSTLESLEITQQGTYTVTVTDLNGCTGEQSYFVSQNNNPAPTISGDEEFCPSTSATVLAETGFTDYVWSDNSINEELTVSTAGTYTVTVTDNNGCTGSAEIVVTELIAPSTVILGTPSFCPTESTMLDAGNGFSNYEWSNNTFNQMVSIDQAGTYTVTVTDATGCTSTAETVVQENIPPSPSIVGASSFCSGNSTTLDAVGSFTDYIWSDNSTDPSIDVSQSGTYTVTVTDASGCTGTAELAVSETTSLLPNITGATDFCPNENTMIEAETGYDTYAWSDGLTTANSITITTAGTYTVTVSDINGCTGTNSIEVLENTPPAPMIAGSTTFCSGFSTTLDVGGNYVDYIWSDNSINSTLEVNTDGIFSVTVTDVNGCTGETSLQVSESTQLQPNISGADSFCSGTSTLLDAGAGFVSYSWSNNSTEQTLAVTTPGTYTVIVSDASGCTGETSLTISENIPVNAGIANMPTSLCSVDNMVIDLQSELTGADLNGVWTETSSSPAIGNGFNATTGEFNTGGQAAGTYTFEYFLAGTGACPDDMEIVTIVIEETPMAIIEPVAELNCNLVNTELDASNSFGGANLSYQWTTGNGNILMGNNSPNPMIDAPGTYELTVELPNGCFSTASIEVTQDVETPTSDAGMNQQLTCTDGQATLTGSSNTTGVEYTWSGPGINSTNMNVQNPMVESAGVYTLVISNPTNGCESSVASVEVIANVDAPTFTLDAVSPLDCNNSSQVLTGPFATNFTYQWFLNGNEISGQTEQSIEVTQPGLYSLQVTNSDNGCNTIESEEVVQMIDAPIVDAGTANLLTCDAGTVTLTGNSSPSNGVSYQWLDPNNNLITNSNSTSIDVTQPGAYTLIVTNNVNGCTSTDQVVVQADNNFPTANAGTDVTLDCDFNTVSLGGNPPTGVDYSYLWTTISGGTVSNPSIPNPTTNEPGTYQLQVTDNSNNCIATAEVIVSETTNIPVEVNFDVTPISCEGENDGSLTIIDVNGGTPPYQYAFDGGSLDYVNSFSFLSAGGYSLNVVDANGCELETEMTLDEPLPFIIDLGPDITIELGESANLMIQSASSFDSLWWKFDETLPCDNCPNPTVEPIQTTSYLVSAINGNGCIDTDDITVFVEKERHVFIPNVFSPNDDGNNDLFMIYGGDDVEKIHTFKIFNRWGETIYELRDFQPNDVTKGWDGYFNGKKMNPAVFVYFAEIEFKDGLKIIYKGDVALRR